MAGETPAAEKIKKVPLIVAGLLLLLPGFFTDYLGLLLVFTADQRQRASVSDVQRLEAERQEREAKRVNDANQLTAALTSRFLDAQTGTERARTVAKQTMRDVREAMGLQY